MESCSIDSELIESLDFLIPPVQRVFRDTNRSTPPNLGDSHVKNIKVLKDFRKKISKYCQFPQSIVRSAESSTSLILKKTTERNILQQYSVLSYTDLTGPRFKNSKNFPNHSPVSQEKPLIKVTVIPKTVPTQPPNVLKRRKNFPKRIHTTVSNQENSIETKNVYLVVQGRKREKVYQIKTTGSAKFSSSRSKNDFKDEVIPIEQLSSLKLVLDSLNMDRDREKDRRRRKKPDVDNFVEFSKTVNENRKYRECTCWNSVRGNEKFRECTCSDEVLEGAEMEDCKSRVRITGHLGLTQDDRYVLRCAATVNDKPIPTDYTTIKPTMPIVSREERKFNNACNRDNCLKRCYNAATYCTSTQKQDFNIQADLQNEMPPMPRVMLGKESQATQVNFINELLDVPKCKNQMIKDEIIQCCRTNVDPRACLSDSESDSNSLRGCQSPLVIISVYPMQDCCENVTVVKKHQDDSKYAAPRKPNAPNHSSRRPSSGTRLNNERKTDNKDSRSRSRSPSPQNTKVSKPNEAKTKFLRTNIRKISPAREVTPYASRSNRQNIKTNQIKTNKPNLTKNSQKYSSAQVKESKGINTEHNLTKKIIVDTYTKELTDYLKSENGETKFRVPKSDPSKITVNIDGENEYYDVLFQQANSTTDLKVRKTFKVNANKKHAESERGPSFTPTMKNSLRHEEPKRKASPEQSKNQHNDDQKVIKTFSRLHVRDSIEIISHRRDLKPPVEQPINTKIDDIGQFSAPIKHYRGDSCPIPDPMIRDKEIRALLGVDKCVHTSATQGLKAEEKKFAVPLHYFYGKTCEKKIVTGINIMEMPEPPCVCCDIRNFSSGDSNLKMPPQQSHKPKSKTMITASPKNPSQHNKRVNATSSKIDMETAPKNQAIGDSDTSEENNPSPMEESPSPVNDSPSPVEDNPLEKSSIHVAEKVPTKRHVTKSIRKSSQANNTGTQYETQVQRHSLYQQLILNRNIQVFLQVEQFSKQKPIILSRKQYDKVKRTIESTIANKTGREYKRKKCICKTSLVSVGDVRRKTNTGKMLHYDKQSQIDKRELANNTKKSGSVSNRSKGGRSAKKQNNTLVLFTKEAMNSIEDKATVTPRQAMSSIEVQFASMSYMKCVTFSTTNAEAGSTCPPPLEQKESHSIHTIFKGHRKCPTPNLGTSLYSLYSEDNNAMMISPRPLVTAQESKQKKPFLRRLMSCLVMRSTRASDLNNVVNPPVKVPSIDSSIDSYHISTSLGAIEVSSSIYDTSASFYSNHSVYPVNSKMRKGFFNSVREFLTIRKS